MTVPLRYALVVSHRRNCTGRFVEYAATHESPRARLVAVVRCEATEADRARRRRGLLRRLGSGAQGSGVAVTSR